MPLNLESAIGKIDRPLHMAGAEFYQIYPDHPAYRYLWHVCLSVNAMTIAVCTLKQLPVPADGYLGLSGKGFDYVVRVPGYSCVNMALELKEPDCIPITIDWQRKPDAHMTWAPQLRSWMESVVWPGFVDLYEHNQKAIHRSNPHLAAMAKLFRDSCAHGGRIMRNKGPSTPIAWDGLAIGREDHGRPLSDFAALGDFLILAIWMCDGFKDRQSRTATRHEAHRESQPT